MLNFLLQASYTLNIKPITTKIPTIIKDININSKNEIGNFLFNVTAMTKTSPNKCLQTAKSILGIKKIKNKYYLNWPITFMIAYK